MGDPLGNPVRRLPFIPFITLGQWRRWSGVLRSTTVAVASLQRGEETPPEHSEGLDLWIVKWVVDPVGGAIELDRRADGDGNEVRLRFERLAG